MEIKNHRLLTFVAAKVWLYRPHCVICHRGLHNSVCYQVQHGCKHKRDFLASVCYVLCAPYFLASLTSSLIYSPSACLHHPWEALSHSHSPPETRGETNGIYHKRARINKSAVVLDSLAFSPRGRGSHRGWHCCCVLLFHPSLTFTHMHTLAGASTWGKNTLFSVCFLFFLSFMLTNATTPAVLGMCEVWCGPPTGLFSIIIGLSWPFQIISIRQELGATDLLHLALSCFLLQHCAHRKYSKRERWIQEKVVAGGVTSATAVWHQRSICGKLMFFHSSSANKS